MISGGSSPHPTPKVSMDYYAALARLLTNSGVEENSQKNHLPATSMVFLGLLLDTVSMTLSVPQEKNG